jgi:hypothetical protein
MKRPKEPALPLPRFDYGLALRNAVSWLGDRYLLAEPVAKRAVAQPAYFAEQPRWNETKRRR